MLKSPVARIFHYSYSHMHLKAGRLVRLVAPSFARSVTDQFEPGCLAAYLSGTTNLKIYENSQITWDEFAAFYRIKSIK